MSTKYVEKIVLYNKRIKNLLIVDGQVNSDETEASVLLKDEMQLSGVEKIIRIKADSSTQEHQVIAFDKDRNTKSKASSKRPYIVYLAN